MTKTTSLHEQAWLAKEALPLDQFIVLFAGDRQNLRELVLGQWAVVVDAIGTTLNRAREANPRLEQET